MTHAHLLPFFVLYHCKLNIFGFEPSKKISQLVLYECVIVRYFLT